MKKEEKTLVINELVEKLNANNKIYLADCSSLTVEKVNQLRKKCFEKNVSITVVKNTLLEKALERAADSKLVELIPALKGATALIFTEVGNAPAKIIKEVSDDMIAWKTKGTALYQSLPAECQATLKECEPLREVEPNRPTQEQMFVTWEKIKNS
jgi:ribosomal protein L10